MQSTPGGYSFIDVNLACVTADQMLAMWQARFPETISMDAYTGKKR